MRFDILTVFPDMLRAVLFESILGNAVERGLLDIRLHNIRDHSTDKHRKTDEYPFGGGRGMVMTPQPIVDCYRQATADTKEKPHTVYMSPQGKILTQEHARELSDLPHLVILCGHYEGVDERVLDTIVDEEISIGDYVLTGGEMPAAILVDCISRMIPGVLPDEECYENESIASGILEYPQYTRPRVFEGLEVPKVLISGHHANIETWRREKALEKTFRVRPDLLQTAALSEDDKRYLKTLQNE